MEFEPGYVPLLTYFITVESLSLLSPSFVLLFRFLTFYLKKQNKQNGQFDYVLVLSRNNFI